MYKSYVSEKCLSFSTFIHQRIHKKVFTKILSLSSTTVFNINTIKDLQIRILEWFLKDHVTLKTDAKKSASLSHEQIHFF